MGRLSASLLTLALGLVAAAALASCGGGGGADLLPGKTAGEINSNLDEVERLAGEDDCVGAADAAEAVSAQIEALGGVDKRLKQALTEGADRLNEVVASCEEEPSEEEVEPVETTEETEAIGESEKPAKEKPEKTKPEKEEPAEPETTQELPPQAKGEGKGLEKGEGPPVEPGSPSGGVGPGTAVEGE